MTETQREFEEAWRHAFGIYRALLVRPEDGQNVVALVSALRGFAWSLYYQGRTDANTRRLAASYVTTQLRSVRRAPRG